MKNKKHSPKEANEDKSQQEDSFTRDTKERNQDFSNEQNPEVEDGSQNKEHPDESSGNLSDQYHSATKTGEIQNKHNKANTKAGHKGKEYYDQGAHQPSLADEGNKDEKKKK